VDYIEIIVSVPAADAERACDVLRDATGEGAWVDTPFTQENLESDAVLVRDAMSRVHVYVRDPSAVERAYAATVASGVATNLVTAHVDEEDWANAWKEHFHVERFGERIVVVPSWREYTPQPHDVVLKLDPGMAFGTGQHETTRMCLEALERILRPGDRVLDVGCGSGILAIAAAKLGARSVRAVDIDENCVRITRENAACNDVSGALEARTGSVGDAWPFDEPVSQAFDVVAVNIIASVIIDRAPALVDALTEGGRLIVSGVIGEHEARVCDALAAAGARISAVRAMGDWRCIEAAAPSRRT
jgi:ribosomal protein L11 methyltransferase